MPRTILITGATGQQGGATLRALTESTRLSDGLSIRLLALTRNSSSQKANALLSIPGVQVVQGDLRDKSSISKIFESYAIDSVFGVQDIFQGNEVEQGTTLVDVAVTYGVKQFVYTSVDMSGLSPSPIPHFETKRQIEEHLKARSSQSQMVYTILRPSAFFGKFFKEVKNVSWEDPEQDVEVGTELTNALNTINVHPFEGTPEETRQLFPWVKDLPTWLDTEFHAGTMIGQLGNSSSH
ncbi:uncharacterized protein L199_000636 [Kwoniella botswanensis]|uniref:uncharacterized protein n=1 Tax=Kwoniella botswanensis TaxID=1268659 RepID=UPI00315D5ECF